MKRNQNLIPLSRDHHFGLLCCWKVNQGLKKGISYERIKAYINFFWKERLKNHFDAEDFVFAPVEKDENFMKMENEHLEIETIITQINTSSDSNLLKQFAQILEKHIRFEERELFTNLEQVLSEDELNQIGIKLDEIETKGDYDYPDKFWKD